MKEGIKMKKENKKPIEEFSQPCIEPNCCWKNSRDSERCYFHGCIVENNHPDQHPARKKR